MYKHGLSNTKLYRKFAAMKQRCYNKNDGQYSSYGGRGVSVCEEWLRDFRTFYNWSLENGYQDGLTIERINPNENYEPHNCCYIPMSKQSNNRRCNVRVGNKTLADISRETGIRYGTIQMRNSRGMTVDAGLFERGKPVVRDDGAIYPSVAFAAKANNVSEGRVRDVCHGRRRQTAGHRFVFLTREEAEAALAATKED